MKVALCLSGQPRFLENAYHGIFKNLIQPNNADVFFHTWFDHELVGARFVTNRNGIPEDDPCGRFSPGTVELLQDLYRPKSFEISPPFPVSDDHLPVDRILAAHATTYTRTEFVSMIYSSWYSIQRSNVLKELYRLKHGFNYDFVIRARFDSSLNMPVPCDRLSAGRLFVDNRDLPPNMIPDWFAVSSNEISNLYASGFNAIQHFANSASSSDFFCGENIVYRIVRAYGIPVVRLNDLVHRPVRRGEG
jgi:hypothetical protein